MKHSIRFLLFSCFALGFHFMSAQVEQAKDTDIKKEIDAHPEVIRMHAEVDKAREAVVQAEVEHDKIKMQLSSLGRQIHDLDSELPDSVKQKTKVTRIKPKEVYPGLADKERKMNSLTSQLEGIQKYYEETKSENTSEANEKIEERIESIKAELSAANEAVEEEKLVVVELKKESIKQDSIQKLENLKLKAELKEKARQDLEKELAQTKADYSSSGMELKALQAKLELAVKQTAQFRKELEKELLEQRSGEKQKGQ